MRGQKAATFIMNKHIVNLDSFKARVKLKQGRVDSAKDALKNAEEDLAQTKESEKVALIACLDRGETTGDPLKDAILRHVGLEEEPVNAVLAFSNQLVAAKDQYAVFCLRREEPLMHVMVPSPGHESTSRTVCHFILGKLTGEPLIAHANEKQGGITSPNFTLPFSAYVAWSSDEKPKEKVNGPLVLNEDLLDGFMGKSMTNQTLFMKIAFPPELQVNDLRFFIGIPYTESGGFHSLHTAIGSATGLLETKDAVAILEATPPDEDMSGQS